MSGDTAAFERFSDNSSRPWRFDRLIINDDDDLNAEDHGGTGTGDHGIVEVAFAYGPARAR